MLWFLLIVVGCEEPPSGLLYEEDFETYKEGRFTFQTEEWKIGWNGLYTDSFDFIVQEQSKVLEITPPGVSEEVYPALLYLNKNFQDFTLVLKARFEFSTQGNIRIGLRCNEVQGYLVEISHTDRLSIKRIDNYAGPVEAILFDAEIPFTVSDKEWHDLRITVISDSIVVILDGTCIGSTEDPLSIQKEGWIGFVSGPDDYYRIDDIKVYSE